MCFELELSTSSATAPRVSGFALPPAWCANQQCCSSSPKEADQCCDKPDQRRWICSGTETDAARSASCATALLISKKTTLQAASRVCVLLQRSQRKQCRRAQHNITEYSHSFAFAQTRQIHEEETLRAVAASASRHSQHCRSFCHNQQARASILTSTHTHATRSSASFV